MHYERRRPMLMTKYRVMELIESIDADTVEELKDKLIDEIGRLA